MYIPSEIVVVDEVWDEPVTHQILNRCPSVPVRKAHTNRPQNIIAVSTFLSEARSLDGIISTGKRIIALVGTTNFIGEFEMPDPRMGCPDFLKLVLVTNGCPYRCAWCFLQGTYRAVFPFMGVRVRYETVAFVFRETRNRFDGPAALCKETKSMWQQLGLDPDYCQCAYQFGEATLFCGQS